MADIGCGEGWLVRDLASRVHRLVGIDAIPELIERARSSGGGNGITHTPGGCLRNALQGSATALLNPNCLTGLVNEDIWAPAGLEINGGSGET